MYNQNPTNPIQPGQFTERLFARLFQSLGYANMASEFPVEALRQFLAERNSQRLEWLDSNYPGDLSASKIVDYAFGIDYLIEVEPTKQLVGFDFTINGIAVKRKVDKLGKSKFLWDALDIHRVVVVHFDLPKGEDQGLIFYDLEDCGDQLLDVTFSALESADEVTSVTIKVLRK